MDSSGTTYPKVISPKMNVITRLEFEHAYFNVTVQHVLPGIFPYFKGVKQAKRE